MKISASSILITGGAKRIGAEIAKTLAQKRVRHLILHYNTSQTQAKKLALELKRLGAKRVSLIQTDLESFEETRSLAQKTLALAPNLNGIVFNASYWNKTPFGRVSQQDWDRHFDVNLKSTFFLAQSLGLAMQKRGRGHIIMIADWSALKPYTKYIPYCLSKTGILYLTRALAKALAPEIQVNAILPGANLPYARASREEIEKTKQANLLKRMGSPKDVAKAVRFFLEDANFSTGTWFSIDGGRLIN